MTQSKTYEKVKAIFIKMGLEATEITPEGNLQKDLGMDSLDLADFVFHIELVFNIKVSDLDFENLVTVEEIVTYLDNKKLVEA